MNTHLDLRELEAMGVDHTPLVEALEVEVDAPSLKDNTALAERLAKAVAKRMGKDHIEVGLSAAKALSEFKTADLHRITAMVRTDHQSQVVVVVKNPEIGPMGLAVDVGSTTLVLALVDLSGPRLLDEFSLANPQTEFGADILTRAHFAEKGDGLSRLTAAVRSAVNRAAEELCRRNGLEPNHLAAAALAGNPAMTHFFLGLPVRTLIREPYVPAVNRPGTLTAAQVGLDIAPEAPVLVLPNRGAYFGGDLMAGLVASGMAWAENPCLLIDVGTNAEVVLGQKDWLIGAAGAAGPALEGGVARMGMVAAPGAVDRVRIHRGNGDVSLHTIGDAPPRGICGSGLIDLFAELFLSGVIDFKGRLTLPLGHPRRRETDEGPAFVLAGESETSDGQAILVSEVEIDILTRSKAAMYTILSTVLRSVGLGFDQLERIFVAGTFGQYIDPKMAVAVGMVPDVPLDRYVPLGNSSLKGAALTLVSGKARAEVDRAFQRLTYLEMNVNQDLMNRFSAARFLPHTDRKRFPSVGTTIV